jgi:hypothetical protein
MKLGINEGYTTKHGQPTIKNYNYISPTNFTVPLPQLINFSYIIFSSFGDNKVRHACMCPCGKRAAECENEPYLSPYVINL